MRDLMFMALGALGGAAIAWQWRGYIAERREDAADEQRDAAWDRENADRERANR